MALPLDPAQCARELARFLNAQAEVCAKILAKSQLQQKLVEENREDELLSLLGDKQKLMDQNEKLAKQAEPFRTQWEGGLRDRAGKAEHALVENAWNKIRDTLDAIIKLEDVSRAYLEKQKNKVSIDIGNLQRGKILNKAYGGAASYRPPATPRYSDKKG